MRKLLMILLCLCLAAPCTANAAKLDASGSSDNSSLYPNAVPKSTPVSVLFIGNSITYSSPKISDNRSIAYFQALSQSSGRDVYIKMMAYGGKALKQLGNPKNRYGRKVAKAIKSRKWDYIVIQENTDYAVAKFGTMKKYAKKLAKTARKYNPDVHIVYNATWAYKKTKRLFRKKYTLETQQALINSHYQQIASGTGGIVCWSGNAFQTFRTTDNSVDLYRKDKNHPTFSGAFLCACSLYATIFRESPAVSTYCPQEVNGSNAAKFKTISQNTCLW